MLPRCTRGSPASRICKNCASLNLIMVSLVVSVMSARYARHLVTRLLQLFGCNFVCNSCPTVRLSTVSPMTFAATRHDQRVLESNQYASTCQSWRLSMSGALSSYIMAKMCISTLRSCKGTQIDDASDLNKDVVYMCLDGVLRCTSVTSCQEAARTNSRAAHSQFVTLHNNLVEASSIRGQLVYELAWQYGREPIPVGIWASASEIANHFHTDTMCHAVGSLNK